jgi:hypothetical protein
MSLFNINIKHVGRSNDIQVTEINLAVSKLIKGFVNR